MTELIKKEFLAYIESQIETARKNEEPHISFILSENEMFSFDDLLELSELMKERFKPTWVLIDEKNRRLRARVVLK